MALITCPECGKEKVSDTATACPKCGYNIREHYSLTDEIKTDTELTEDNFEDDLYFIHEDAPLNQEEEIEKLSRLVDGNSFLIIFTLGLCILFITLTVICWNHNVNASLGLLIVLFGFLSFFSILLFLAAISASSQTSSDLVLAKTDFEEYKEQIRERKIKAAKAEDRKIEIYAAQHPECPACKGHDTERISTLGRTASVAFGGLASKTIGKQYICNTCGHMW